jgi:hypothetical protein
VSSVEERLARVERSNRRLRVALAALVLGAGAAVATGATLAGAAQPEVRTRSLVIVDAQGHTRAQLGVYRGAVSLSLMGRGGGLRAFLSSGSRQTELGLLDPNGILQVRVGLRGSQPFTLGLK